MDYEQKFVQQGCTVIVGMDEAGYGAWAGPVVAAAVCLPLTNADLTTTLRGVKDSKQMTPKQRADAYDVIWETAIGCGVGAATPGEIDDSGLAAALVLAYRRAYDQCASGLEVEVVLIDGLNTWRAFDSQSVSVERIPKGDTLSLSIAAASVLAKVWRDREMVALAQQHPAYSFERHKGYGTAAHLAALKQNGVLKGVHRHSYKPIAALLG